MNKEPHRRRSVAWTLGSLLLALYLWATAIFTVGVLYRPLDVFLLWLIYLLLAATLVFAVRWAVSKHPALGGAMSVGLALVAIWHLREQTRSPESLVVLAALVLVLGLTVYLVARRLPLPARGPRLKEPVVAGLACLGLLISVFFLAPSQRWHLLRHNTLLGTPLYYGIAEPVPEIATGLLARAGEPPSEKTAAVKTEDPSPDWRRPNLVVVMVDTLRADALAPWGGDPSVTPNLSRWLEDSYRFTDVLANSSWTRPSVGSLFTGLLPEEHGARNTDDGITEGLPTFAEQLKGLGYQTAALVTNAGAAGSDAGFDRGFEDFHEFTDEPYARADKVNRTLEAWFERRDPEEERPLLLYLHYLDPHDPYLSGDAPKRERSSDYRLAYRRELEFFDLNFQALLEILRDRLGEDTKLLLTSDHGEEFFEHGLFGHGHSLYQEVVHIPVALGGLGVDPSARQPNTRTAESNASGELAARLEGRDFHDLILRLATEPEHSTTDWASSQSREQRYLSLYFTGSGRLMLRPYRQHNLMRALDEPDRKLVWSGYGSTFELYDLATDPLELRNLAWSEHDRVSRMSTELDQQVDAWVLPGPVSTDSEGRKQLRTLGYID